MSEPRGHCWSISDLDTVSGMWSAIFVEPDSRSCGPRVSGSKLMEGYQSQSVSHPLLLASRAVLGKVLRLLLLNQLM